MKILIWFVVAALVAAAVYIIYSLNINPEVFTGAKLI